MVDLPGELAPEKKGAIYFRLLGELESLFNRKVDLLLNQPFRNPYFARAVDQLGYKSTYTNTQVRQEHYLEASVIGLKTSDLIAHFQEFKDDITQRFNKVELIIYPDGTYKANYLPDYLNEGVMDHYQLTNYGLLKENWQP